MEEFKLVKSSHEGKSKMSKEYITKSEAIEAACKAVELFPSEYHEMENAINSIPAANVMEVRHGRWICINKRYGEYECSVCHDMDSNCSDYYGIHAVTEQEFCSSCGAKMAKEVADETCICQPWAEQT